MTRTKVETLADAVRRAAQPLTGAAGDYDALLDLIGEARFVLIGEASHGTHEFYRERAAITRRLIRERGFTAVAVEADWPDAYRVNCYVRGAQDDPDPEAALGGFRRFPAWMWRNTVVRDFVGWLRAYNDALPPGQPKAGFYGLDLYSMTASMEEVLGYLDKVDPEAARRARGRYACFDHFGEDPQAYGASAGFNLTATCEDEVINQLLDLQQRATQYTGRDGAMAEDDFFYAEQNARLVKNAEEYYRSMFRGQVSSWNLRDTHMAETLDALVRHLDRNGGRAKVVLWAHNSHLGDASATEMAARGEYNVGQLVRRSYGRDAVLVGFTTHSGAVTAANDWDEPPQRQQVRPGLPGSYEALFHEAGLPAFLLPLMGGRAPAGLEERRLERAIGVIYRPETERASHYFHARLPDQFDAILHIDQTHALQALDAAAPPLETDEPPETYPTSL
jgi:erythromycin esterase-like protein